MSLVLSVLIAVLVLVSARAEEASSDFETPWRRANEAYQERRFDDARDIYEDLSRQGFESAELYYNLGNAYYQSGERGKAAWMYEKALALAPRLSDARKNLRLARAEIPSPETDTFFLFKPLEWICYRLTAGEWAKLFLVLSLHVAVFSAVWMLRRPGAARRSAKFAALSTLALLFIVGCFFLPRYISSEWRQYGVVIAPDAVVRNAPSLEAEKYFEAPEGERFQIEESDTTGWTRVKDPATGRVGYLPDVTLGKI